MDVVKKYEVKVVAEYIAYIELEDGEELSSEEIEEMAWKEFYDNSSKASIEEVTIEDEQTDCAECGEEDIEEDSHECEEEEDNSDNSEE